MKKILLLGSQHGNELLGEKLFKYISENNPNIAKNVTYLVGNIKAYRQKVRQIESDLNRSYNGGSATYEERRAKTILRYIDKMAFDLVLDLHTTTCEQPPCMICAGGFKKTKRFINASSIDKVIYMRNDIAKGSLIGACPMAVSIEVNEHSLNTLLLGRLTSDIKRYIRNIPGKTEQTTYVVSEVLKKGELPDSEIGKLRNFEYSAHGFYPILVGEKAYKEYSDYLGFKASEVRRNRV